MNHCSVITPGWPVLCSYNVFSVFAGNLPPFMAEEKVFMSGVTGTAARTPPKRRHKQIRDSILGGAGAAAAKCVGGQMSREHFHSNNI